MIDEIVSELGAKLGKSTDRYSVIVRSNPGSICSDWALVTFHSQTQKLKFFIKIAKSEQFSPRISQEAEILMKLKERGVKDIPELIISGVSSGRSYLVERYIGGTLLSRLDSQEERLRKKLEWMKQFFIHTLEDATIDPEDIIRRAEKALNNMSSYCNLTPVLQMLEKFKPNTNLPAVCRHGDLHDENCLVTENGMTVIDFDVAKFHEPPSEPYRIVPPSKLIEYSPVLDLLKSLEGINPLFLALYDNTIMLASKLQLQRELEDNLVNVDRMDLFPRKDLGRIEELLRYSGCCS